MAKKGNEKWMGDKAFSTVLLRADGFDSCVMGLGRTGNEWTIVYDEDKVIGLLCDRDGMTLSEARDFFESKIASAYVGEGTPTFVRIMNLDGIIDATK